MASSNNITNIYESYAELSFVDKKNFKHNILPTLIVGAFIPCFKIDEFYCDTLLYLHLFASLYYELNHFLINNNNSIALFKKCIDNLQIQIINDAHTDASHAACIGYLNATVTNGTITGTPIFKFSLTTFKTRYIDTTGVAYKTYNGDRYDVIKPILDSLSASNNIVATTPTVIDLFGLPEGSINTDSWSKTSTIDTGDYSATYNSESRYNMIKKIIKGILEQGHENIMSYLLYYTIYYHIIVYNTCIQNEINHMYLHNNKNRNTGTITPLKSYIDDDSATISFDTTYSTNATIVKSLITNLKNNIGSLESKYLGSGSVDYIDNKSKYASKIEVLNDIKIEFDKIQNELNITIKEYNKYIKNFQKVKTYANFIIIVLIAIIIITILVTVLDSITPNFKNYYYVIAFIILAFITFVYYNNFSHINLYERFTNVYVPDVYTNVNDATRTPITGDISTCIQNTFDLTNPAAVNGRNTHINYINKLTTELNSYNATINNIMNGLRTNIYTANYGVFTKDGNTYLYNLYIEKKNQNESNRIKKVALANMLDTMKRHIVYLFNIILLISLLTIILLFGLILFSNFPFYLNYIIILCIILISIIIIYFINSIVQPTRMLINKNYWANKNPSKILLAKV
jgi:hypothetical protein